MHEQLALFDVPEAQCNAPVHPNSAAPSLYQEFLFLLAPSHEIVADVRSLKDEFGAIFGEFPSRHSVGHVTLIMARMAISDEARLVGLMRDVCGRLRPFPLHFDGFDHFIGNRTIFINPVEKASILELAFTIEHALKKATGFQRSAARVSPWPHMTVLKGMFRKGEFKEAWEMPKGRLFKRWMLAETVLVFRRPDRKTRCTLVGAFMLGGSAPKASR